MTGVSQLWVYLQTTPLLGLAATLIAWEVAVFASRVARGHVLANPMLISIVLLSSLLLLTHTPYRAYFEGGQYVQFLLGPATVALAVPMYFNLGRIRRAAPAILPALVAGSLVAALSAMLIARGLGASRTVVLSLAPKSVTTPIAMGIAEQIGGSPSLAAVFVLLTGLTAVVIGPGILRFTRVRDWRARGLAAGTAGHGLATARILLLDETAGAFGGLAIGLNGIFTAILVPFLATLF
ncbi:LrgB family protein [Acidisphaera sp. L21]|jgi:predicted murein hydrolase (TIGR00659 family)|uniref:LrgB family protein n=1 Tax=Acidisphaera sp. L21 TaxID=1641851 RepID=UPI00131CA031|nr:LrgB family protein [Acidisphaera sp. L21]